MKIFYTLLSVCLVLAIVACKNEKQPGTQTEKPKSETPKKPSIIASESYTINDTVTWQGRVYTYKIIRFADKDAEIVTNEDGQKFYDNQAEVKILRSDSSTFYSQTFTKGSFSRYLPKNLKENGILEGLVFEKAEKDYLQLAASVALPQSDEYLPFAIRISPNGKVTVVQVNMMLEE